MQYEISRSIKTYRRHYQEKDNVSLYISMVFGILAAVSTTSSCFASGLVNSFVFIHLSVLKAPTHELFCVILEGFFSKRRFYDIVYACCI